MLSDRVFHLADARNWASIQLHGLLSTSALLDLLDLRGDERERLERRHRPLPVTLRGGIRITDQKPMPPQALRRCLPAGTTPAQWYALLNGKVFFWLDADRLNRQLRAGGEVPRVVLVLDAASLLSRYAGQVALSPINSGAALRRPAVRGPATFVPYHTWRATGWSTEAEALGTRPRARSHRPAELTIDRAVPDVMAHTIEVRSLDAGEPFVP